ncbi:MAG: hypothetical protein WAW10_11135 [Gallionella sp.]
MNEALQTLEDTFAENKMRLSTIENEIEKLKQEYEYIKKNNEHLAYSIGLIKKPSAGRIRIMRSVAVETPVIEEKKTLRSIVLGVIKDGESISVGSTFDRVTNMGVEVTRPVINSTLHNLVKRGDLEQPEIGLYRKVES